MNSVEEAPTIAPWLSSSIINFARKHCHINRWAFMKIRNVNGSVMDNLSSHSNLKIELLFWLILDKVLQTRNVQNTIIRRTQDRNESALHAGRIVYRVVVEIASLWTMCRQKLSNITPEFISYIPFIRSESTPALFCPLGHPFHFYHH